MTGEVKHHVALLAASLGLNIIEIGHYAGEHVFIPRMAQLLQTEADKQNMKIQFTAAESEKNPENRSYRGVPGWKEASF